MTFVEVEGDVGVVNSRIDQVLEDFEATTGERNGAKVGGQGRVPTLEDRNNGGTTPKRGRD